MRGSNGSWLRNSGCLWIAIATSDTMPGVYYRPIKCARSPILLCFIGAGHYINTETINTIVCSEIWRLSLSLQSFYQLWESGNSDLGTAWHPK